MHADVRFDPTIAAGIAFVVDFIQREEARKIEMRKASRIAMGAEAEEAAYAAEMAAAAKEKSVSAVVLCTRIRTSLASPLDWLFSNTRKCQMSAPHSPLPIMMTHLYAILMTHMMTLGIKRRLV